MANTWCNNCEEYTNTDFSDLSCEQCGEVKLPNAKRGQ